MQLKHARRIFLNAGLGMLLAWTGFFSVPVPADADTDVGNIAVIETDATILQPGEFFDLNGKTITFTPKTGGGYTVTVGALNFDSRLGIRTSLGDNQFGFIDFTSFTFPFFGFNHARVFVNPNGNLTFGNGSTEKHFNAGGSVTSLGSDLQTILDNMASFLPRIAPLWQDWNPAAGGGVFFNLFSNALIVTWNGVPLFGTSTTATFQVILFSSGVIQMNYQSVTTTPGGGYLVGVSPGRKSRNFVTTIDYSQGSASSISAFPNEEPLVQVFGNPVIPMIHLPAVGRRFYQSHDDDFDQIVLFANFFNGKGNTGLVEFPIRETVGGIGDPAFDLNISSFFGSAGQLQSIANMNRLGIFPADPAQTGFAGTNSTLDLLGQEVGHQWLAFVRFEDGQLCSDALLGRALAHWSFFKDSDASDVEGNSWVDNSDGTFTTDEATERFSALDQYIMGLRQPGEVPDFFFIKNPTNTGGRTRSSPPEIGVTVNGTRQDVTINQIIRCNGARSPSSGFTAVNPTTTWKQVFILLIRGGTTAPQADLDKLDTIRTAWVPYFNVATGGRGSVDTTISASASFTLTVTLAGTGSGTVTSSPAGINCGADCSEMYDSGTVVTLTATPDAGSVFAGWSGGGCAGTGTCTVTMNADTAVTAGFEVSPLPLLDVDGNGTADFNDGVVIQRFLFGFRGATLTQGVDPNGTRTTPEDIVAFLEPLRTTMLDVDCNGRADALTDGMLIVRFLLGFEGDTLTVGAVDPRGCRSTAAAIAEFLEGFLPG